MRIFIGSRAQYEEVNHHPNANDCFIQRGWQFSNNIRDELSDCVQNGLEFEIIILNNVTRIGNEAFKVTNQNAVCNRLRSVTILGNLVSIGKEAFKGCSHLQTINGVGIETATEIGDSAFEDCQSLTIFPELLPNLHSVGSGVFRNCSFPHNIVGRIPPHRSILLYSPNDETNVILSNVNEIGDGVFDGHAELQSIQIPDNVTRIGENAFRDCSNLQRLGSYLENIQLGEFILPPHITKIEDGTFEGCTQLQSIQIPDTTAEIGWLAFTGCTSLESIHLNAVTGIGGGAFYNCTNLQTAIMPNVRRIGWYAFAGCPNLTAVDIPVQTTQEGGFIRSGAFCRRSLTENSRARFMENDPRVDVGIPAPNPNAQEQNRDNLILDRMVSGIIQHYDEWMKRLYNWAQGQNVYYEDTTANTFYLYSHNLLLSLNALNSHSIPARDETLNHFLERCPQQTNTVHGLRNSVNAIILWGRGADNDPNNLEEIQSDDNELDDFTRALIRIRLNNIRDIRSILDEGRGQTSRIAFWTKILAAYQPGRFFIYDSRVALALSYISLYLNLPDFWYVPKPRNDKPLKRLGLTIPANDWNILKINRNTHLIQGYDISTCYGLYLDLLQRIAERIIQRPDFEEFFSNGNTPGAPGSNRIREVYENEFGNHDEGRTKSIMAHLEKMLFMMKEYILNNFNNE